MFTLGCLFNQTVTGWHKNSHWESEDVGANADRLKNFFTVASSEFVTKVISKRPATP